MPAPLPARRGRLTSYHACSLPLVPVIMPAHRGKSRLTSYHACSPPRSSGKLTSYHACSPPRSSGKIDQLHACPPAKIPVTMPAPLPAHRGKSRLTSYHACSPPRLSGRGRGWGYSFLFRFFSAERILVGTASCPISYLQGLPRTLKIDNNLKPLPVLHSLFSILCSNRLDEI